jgi:hypothetical protein
MAYQLAQKLVSKEVTDDFALAAKIKKLLKTNTNSIEL